MSVKMTQIQSDKFNNEYDVISKLGEGSFGEAFKVRSRLDGNLYAIKKAKQKYIGFRDRD
jgi:membrane-associated tyrosine/threonine-specific cdc2-inhibitory kinase